MDRAAETARINDFVERGNYHAAINISISAMNECRRQSDQEGVNYFIELIRSIVERMQAVYGTPL